LDPLLPERARHGEAVAARQHYIKHDEVEGFAGGSSDSRVAVACRFDLIAFRGQSIG
jgi:hypothetical protein